MQISILQGSAGGSAVYVETHTPTTNVNGLASIGVGTGTVVGGTFSNISWSGNSYFLKTEIDPAGVTNYTVTATTQMLTVPYSMYSKTATSATNGIQAVTLSQRNGLSPTTGQVVYQTDEYQGLYAYDGDELVFSIHSDTLVEFASSRFDPHIHKGIATNSADINAKLNGVENEGENRIKNDYNLSSRA